MKTSQAAVGHCREQHRQEVTENGRLGNPLESLQPEVHVVEVAADKGVASL